MSGGVSRGSDNDGSVGGGIGDIGGGIGTGGDVVGQLW